MIGHDDPIAIVIHFLQAGRKRATLPGTEESMTTTIEFITALFCQVDDQLAGLPKHPEARLWPSEVVTLGLLHALKGGGNRAFYRWLTRDYRPLFPRLPERTRLFRLFRTHHDWTKVFLAAPTVLGVIDTYGIELLHPIREGRSPHQIGRKGLSNHRWTLLLDSRVVACEDGVNWRHLMPRSLTGVQPCKSTLRISSMMCSVIRRSASCAGPTAWRAPRVSRYRSSSVALMTRNPPVSAMSVTTVTDALMI